MLLNVASGRLASSSRAAQSYAAVWRYVTASYVVEPQASRNPSRLLPLHRGRRSLHTSRELAGEDTAAKPEAAQVLESYKQSLDFPSATHNVKDLSNDHPEGTPVVLQGYLQNRSDISKKLSFVPLLDSQLSHRVQIISSSTAADGGPSAAHAELKKHGAGTPVTIQGRLKSRKPASGASRGQGVLVDKYEVQLDSLTVLNEMPGDILFTPDAVYPPEQRHLAMKQDDALRSALVQRARIANLCRKVLDDHSFTEVETPLLFKSTPEGAREFVVPTRRPGWAYALPQSPQQFKQVLMGSGIARYYQLARCFRDEDLRADRQPEFTQLDLEMAFAGGREVMAVVTALIQRLWKEVLAIDLPTDFDYMKYQDAMAKYGVDKPDVRLGMEIKRIDYLLPVDLVSKISPLTLPAVDAFALNFRDGSESGQVSPSQTRKFVASFLESDAGSVFQNNPAGGPGIFICESTRPMSGLQALGWEAAEVFEQDFNLEDGDLLVLQARPDVPFSGGSTPLGNLRVALHRAAVSAGLVSAPEGFAPLWITDFPLFTPNTDSDASEPGQGGAAGFSSTHHPFTAPKTAADVDKLLTAPHDVVGEHYDLVMNGIELGGGSRRIHNAAVQRLVMERVLRMPPDRVAEFDHLLDVLRAGCPPHAGIALGFDRLVAVMLGRSSVRDVIAFPKTGSGEDPLMRSPGRVGEERLREYHLKEV